MSQSNVTPTPQSSGEKKQMSLLIRGAIWIAIGALIAAALVCVVWVLLGDQDGLIGRAFLTILLLAAFAGIAILEAGIAPNRPDWLAVSSMTTWIVVLLVGAIKVWLPEDDYDYTGAESLIQFIFVIGILQLALVHLRLFTPAARRHRTTFIRVIYIATLVFLGGLVAMLVFFLTFSRTFDYDELYWRIVVALTILAAVGTTLIPLLNALFAPKKQKKAAASSQALLPWPTYADGRTPLPMLPDASPDWNAYYTGRPTYPQQQAVSAPSAPSQSLAAPTVASSNPTAPSAPPASPASPAAPMPPPPAAPTPPPPAPSRSDEGNSPMAPPAPPRPQ